MQVCSPAVSLSGGCASRVHHPEQTVFGLIAGGGHHPVEPSVHPCAVTGVSCTPHHSNCQPLTCTVWTSDQWYIFPYQVRQQCRPDGGVLPAPQPPSVDNALLSAVQALPKTGSKKARLLLSKFESEGDGQLNSVPVVRKLLMLQV